MRAQVIEFSKVLHEALEKARVRIAVLEESVYERAPLKKKGPEEKKSVNIAAIFSFLEFGQEKGEMCLAIRGNCLKKEVYADNGKRNRSTGASRSS